MYKPAAVAAGDAFPEPLGLPFGLGIACAAVLAVPPEALLGVTLAVAVLDMDGRRTLPVCAAVVCFWMGTATGCSRRKRENLTHL